jgi:Fe2+ or Zn2+ uptake regulation protein
MISGPELDRLTGGIAERLRRRGLRRTKALDLLIGEMAQRDKPVTIAELSQSAALSDSCDPATVYRLLMKLETHGVVRRLGLHDRSAYFILNLPERHHDYLVCTGCGTIAEVDMECPVRALERRLEKSSGFRHVYHELEFFGIVMPGGKKRGRRIAAEHGWGACIVSGP